MAKIEFPKLNQFRFYDRAEPGNQNQDNRKRATWPGVYNQSWMQPVQKANGISFTLNSDEISPVQFGLLYNWFAVNDAAGMAPAGWRVATRIDFQNLSAYVGASGGLLKDVGTTYWTTPNTNGQDTLGWRGLPTGYVTTAGLFVGVGTAGYWWTATEYNTTNAYYYGLAYNNNSFPEGNVDKNTGFAIRMCRAASGYTGGDTYTDADGNIYDIINLYGTLWMVQNWACTKFADGSSIALVTDNSAWAAASTDAYCYYNDNLDYVYGYDLSASLYKVSDFDKYGDPSTYTLIDEITPVPIFAYSDGRGVLNYTYDTSALDDGFYVVRVTALTTVYESNVFELKASFDDCYKLEVSNFENDFGVIWDEYTLELMIPYRMYKPIPKLNKDVYSNSSGQLTTLRSIPQRAFELETMPIPLWYAELLQLCTACSDLTLNGEAVNFEELPAAEPIGESDLAVVKGECILVDFNTKYLLTL